MNEGGLSNLTFTIDTYKLLQLPVMFAKDLVSQVSVFFFFLECVGVETRDLYATGYWVSLSLSHYKGV